MLFLGGNGNGGGDVISESSNAARRREEERDKYDVSRRWSHNFGFMDIEAPPLDPATDKIINDPTLMHTLVMVPCYSEGEESLRATLDSLAATYYPSTHKVCLPHLLFFLLHADFLVFVCRCSLSLQMVS
jgi:hypothetical protein